MQELACIRCGYALRGTSPGGACPECGTPAEDSLRALSALDARARKQVRIASIMSAVAALGWIPLAIFAFDRWLPPLLGDIVGWILGFIHIVPAGAAGFGATGTMLAILTVLLVRVLGWRGRAVWATTMVFALAALSCGILLSIATLRLASDAMEPLLLVQAIAGILVTALWGLVYRRVTGGRGRWPAATLVIGVAGAAAWAYAHPYFPRYDPWLPTFVACTVFSFASCAALGRACLRSASRPLEHRRKPLPDADAQ